MDPTSWSAYSQHFSRLGASMNHPQGPLSQQAQMNDLALSSPLSRQEHLPGYGNTGGPPHPFLLAASHGLNPNQTNPNDPSFNANLFAANYDASLFSTSFPPANKGHLPSFPQSAAGLFKTVNRENDFNDLRTGFSHCGMSPYARNSDGNSSLSSGSGLASGHMFPNSMPPGTWRHSGIIPSQCGPFGVLPHETVLQRSHLVGRGGEKLSVQASKQSRNSIPSSYVEQDLSRGYRGILSSSARPSSAYVDSVNTSHSSLMPPQNDPYYSSVNDNYYSSCSKNDFAAYNSYCSNMQPGVQRSITPYCYPQSFGNYEVNPEKQETPTTNTNSSANSNYTSFVPNSNINGNPSHLHNGQVSRQSVITSNINNSSMFNSDSHPPQSHSYNMRDSYPYPPGAAHASTCQPTHHNNRVESGSSRQALAHMNNNHHSSVGQNLYPPMSTPVPASTPAHTTPPSSTMGQAYVPTPMPMSHDSGCSSVNSQSIMYRSPSNDGCFSTPGTCHSESDSPAKQDLSQHSSPSVYSIESSNLSVNSTPYIDSSHTRSHSNSEANYNMVNGGLEAPESAVDSSKVNEEAVTSTVIPSDCRSQPKDSCLPQALPIDMVKMNKDNNPFQSTTDSHFERQAGLTLHGHCHTKHLDSNVPSHSECSNNGKSDGFPFSSTSPSPALDFTAKAKNKQEEEQKPDDDGNSAPLNCTYSHLQSTQPTSDSTAKPEEAPLSNNSLKDTPSPAVDNELAACANSSPHPVDLSSSVSLSTKKQESTVEKNEKEPLPELNYDDSKATEGKWSVTKPEVTTDDKPKPLVTDASESLKSENSPAKIPEKCVSPICQPMDDLSDESKKLCNSIEDDLGFLAGLSSDPEVEDSTSKGSFSEKKVKKDKGFLQSFLTFLESSNEPNVNSETVIAEEKKVKKDETVPIKEQSEKKDSPTSCNNSKSDASKSMMDENEDKDNFDEAPSLDPTLFGCSSLQKEMVVPNPEAPSFSSDEDENSTQGIFDSVAMAIQRLCEDNEEDHTEKGNRGSGKLNTKKEMPVLTSMAETCDESKAKLSSNESQKGETVEECTIKRSCIMRGRRGKRRRRHLLVIKVKRAAEKLPSAPVVPRVQKEVVPKVKRPRTGSKEPAQPLKSSSNAAQRRTLMRKCKEKSLHKKNSRTRKRKTRNCMKRKYTFEENSGTSNVSPTEPKETEILKEHQSEDKMECLPSLPTPSLSNQETSQLNISKPEAKNFVLPTLLEAQVTLVPLQASEIPSCTTIIKPPPPKKKKVNTQIGYRTRKRRRKPRKPPDIVTMPLFKQLPFREKVTHSNTTKVDEASTSTGQSDDSEQKQTASSSENCWSVETHFKTGDFVISIDNKDTEYPPVWRIEGKNVLQLFEAVNGEDKSNILYRNTSSYSRWSPSSKHKYLKQLVKIIKSDDDTVIVELIASSQVVTDKDNTGSCDYTVHPQRENFEVYLQTLVSHALDSDFIPEIIKEKDEYFLSHLQVIEDITSQKKTHLHPSEKWNEKLITSLTKFPHISFTSREEDDNATCQVCVSGKVQFSILFREWSYDPLTLNGRDVEEPSESCFPLCGACVQTLTLYSRLQHHRFHFFQQGCKKVKDVKKGEEKDSHIILEECLQDIEWVNQMFQEMLEMWSSCDKYR